MANDNKIHMPGVFGGLMRYDDEYKSKFMLSPTAVVIFVVGILVLAFLFRVFFPVGG